MDLLREALNSFRDASKGNQCHAGCICDCEVCGLGIDGCLQQLILLIDLLQCGKLVYVPRANLTSFISFAV